MASIHQLPKPSRALLLNLWENKCKLRQTNLLNFDFLLQFSTNILASSPPSWITFSILYNLNKLLNWALYCWGDLPNRATTFPKNLLPTIQFFYSGHTSVSSLVLYIYFKHPQHWEQHLISHIIPLSISTYLPSTILYFIKAFHGSHVINSRIQSYLIQDCNPSIYRAKIMKDCILLGT